MSDGMPVETLPGGAGYRYTEEVLSTPFCKFSESEVLAVEEAAGVIVVGFRCVKADGTEIAKMRVRMGVIFAAAGRHGKGGASLPRRCSGTRSCSPSPPLDPTRCRW